MDGVAHTQALWTVEQLLPAARQCASAHESSPLEAPGWRVRPSGQYSRQYSRQYSGSPWLPAVLRASSAKSSEKPELESVST